MTTLRTWRTIEPPPLNCHPKLSLTLPRLLNLSVAGSITGLYRPLVLLRRRRGSKRRSAHFVKTVDRELESMSESNSISSSVHPSYTEIVVVRHGETEWNAGRKIQGHIDVDLNEVGRQQAALVAERLSKETKISAVYSSDLKRAFDTAQAIADRCGGLEVIKDLGLRERHLGDLQGLVYGEASKVCPQAFEAFLSHDSSQDIPGGGESLDQVFERCTSSFERIAAKHKGERVVVVSHGGTIRALHMRACPHKKPRTVLNTSVHIFHLSDGDQWTIKSWGDVSHLNNETGVLKSGFGGDRTSG